MTEGQSSGPDAAGAEPADARRRRRRVARLGGALVALSAPIAPIAPIGWMVTDRLERDDDFCNACHLGEAGVPLHLEVRRGYDARPAASLAAVHGAARVADGAGDERSFRCIDCHGGTSWIGRARVKALAAKDAFWYVVGHFEEPDAMRWPLWDEDCRKCHDRFDESEAPFWQSPRFHQLPVHNADLGVACVECHLVHEAGGNPDAGFLHASHVRAQCARCHPEFEDVQEGTR